MAKDRNIDFYRENRAQLRTDMSQCVDDVKSNDVPISVCWSLGAIATKLKDEDWRNRLVRDTETTNRELREAMGKAARETDIDVTWGPQK